MSIAFPTRICPSSDCRCEDTWEEQPDGSLVSSSIGGGKIIALTPGDKPPPYPHVADENDVPFVFVRDDEGAWELRPCTAPDCGFMVATGPGEPPDRCGEVEIRLTRMMPPPKKEDGRT